MKRRILRIEDSNMAGFFWWYNFNLSRCKDSTLTLAITQSARGENRVDIDPKAGLRTGADIYIALSEMLSEMDFDIENFDLDEIATEIAALGEDLENAFRCAPDQVNKILERERQARLAYEQSVISPFSERIEAYLSRISDKKLYYPGAGNVYPSERYWTRRFLEQYVLENGKLPTGLHRVYVAGSNSYSGPERDFSDL